MELTEPRTDPLQALNAELLEWFSGQALALWDEHGIDRRGGGYFEQLLPGSDGATLAADGALRRGRVVARQIYVFDLGRRLGWRSPHADPVGHGCEYLLSTLLRPDGLFHTSVDAVSRRCHEPFSLYEHAFYLFALARLRTWCQGRLPVEERALECLAALRRVAGRTGGGFEEAAPPSLPLKSNPHMHLLEAALEWLDAASPGMRANWVALARELVGLCLDHFIDPRSGAVREYFAADWRPAAGEAGRLVEPGHQFEWAWLLMGWAERTECFPEERRRCLEAAAGLVEVGERAGVDPARGVAVNELWDDLTVKDAAAKLWPQTERLKAWCAVLDRARGAEADAARAMVTAAARVLLRYLSRRPAGLWHETLLADGRFAAEPCKASSLYHIACALDTLRGTAARQVPGMAAAGTTLPAS